MAQERPSSAERGKITLRKLTAKDQPFPSTCLEHAMRGITRSPVYDAAIQFRVAESLLLSAEEKARREGMTLSELLRHALRRELRDAA